MRGGIIPGENRDELGAFPGRKGTWVSGRGPGFMVEGLIFCQPPRVIAFPTSSNRLLSNVIVSGPRAASTAIELAYYDLDKIALGDSRSHTLYPPSRIVSGSHAAAGLTARERAPNASLAANFVVISADRQFCRTLTAQNLDQPPDRGREDLRHNEKKKGRWASPTANG